MATIVKRAEDAAKLVTELRDVFDSKRTRSYEWRVSQIKAVKEMALKHEKDIMEALHKDLRKPAYEAFLVECSIPMECDATLKMLKQWMTPTKVSPGIANIGAQAKIVSDPYGVCLIIGPWNFPVMLTLSPLLGALAAGNAVLVKPSELAPASSALLARLLPQYCDAEAVRVVEGGVEETQRLLEQRWDKIFYTGGTAVGRLILAAAAPHLTPCTLELGGKSPCIVDETADLKVSAKRIAATRLINAGQMCIAPDYVLVVDSVADKLVELLKEAVVEMYGDDPCQSADLARIISRKHFDRLARMIHDPEVAGKIVLGGKTDEKELYVSPTLIRDAPWTSAVMAEEIFGPILPILTVRSVDEAVRLVNARPKPLALYFFSSNAACQQQMLEDTSSGGVCINDCFYQVAVPDLPFGGVGESGMGAYHGKHSFDCFSHKKGVLVKSFSGDASIRYPPYTDKKLNIMRAILSGKLIHVLLLLLNIRK